MAAGDEAREIVECATYLGESERIGPLGPGYSPDDELVGQPGMMTAHELADELAVRNGPLVG